MYVALFLSPWVLIYALSTLAMNHHHFFQNWYDHQPVKWELDREIPYEAVFSDGVKRERVAEQILSDLDMDGAHRVRGSLNNQLTITRHNAVKPQRIIYAPKVRTLRIETQTFRTNVFLEQLHRRRGYDRGYLNDDLWAIAVDLFFLSTVVWAISGVWMWWELKATRQWGAICIGSGIAIFAFFLFTI